MRFISSFFGFLLLFPSALHAEDISSLRSAIAAFERSRVCPQGGEYTLLKFESYCKQYCDLGWTCRGSKETDPCYGASGSPACAAHTRGSSACLKDMNDSNATLNAYNAIIRRCNQAARSLQSPRVAVPGVPTQRAPSGPTALERALEQQRARTGDAAATNNRNRQNTEAFVRDADREMTELQRVRKLEEEVRRNQQRIREQIERERRDAIRRSQNAQQPTSQPSLREQRCRMCVDAQDCARFC